MADPALFALTLNEAQLEIYDILTLLDSKKHLLRDLASDLQNVQQNPLRLCRTLHVLSDIFRDTSTRLLDSALKTVQAAKILTDNHVDGLRKQLDSF
jgi:hypothetical protein